MAAPEGTDAALPAAVRSSRCPQLLEHREVLSVACLSNVPVLASKETERPVTEVFLTHGHRNGVWEHGAHDRTKGVRSLEPVGVTAWRRGWRERKEGEDSLGAGCREGLRGRTGKGSAANPCPSVWTLGPQDSPLLYQQFPEAEEIRDLASCTLKMMLIVCNV